MKLEVINGGLCAVKGVRAYGIKEGSKGLAIIEGAGKATGAFTTIKTQAAPVRFTKKQLESGWISAIIANSGCANSFTGVRPISCHPPGLAMGYIPVCALAIPTDPSGTKVRGVFSLGV